ncbi:hypothetical protein N3K66_006555 [Trichothecium roseum]|uniref:Uncharacterized protein n=1 Tax=Trichothecium roseum TaxID=47278 RepID=A0ACC0UXD9_9HYPO|nr:hypothetical protein N3K66_006555 [Trichothecium roseum]
MIPPIDDSVLQSNPDFAVLYKRLTTEVLAPDGSSKNDPADRKRNQVKDDLHKHRLRAAKHNLLTSALASATAPEKKAAPKAIPSSKGIAAAPPRTRAQHHQHHHQQQQEELSEDLLDLLVLLPPLLDPEQNSSLDDESVRLLLSSPPLSDLEHLLPELGELAGASLHSSALGLARIANPSTNPSYLHRSIPSLPASVSSLQAAHTEAAQALAGARAETLASLLPLLATYAQALTTLIRSLESKHTVLARSSLLHAQTTSLDAQQADLSLQSALHGLQKEVYSAKSIAALQTYSAHLRDARSRLEERIRGLEMELSDYGVGVDGGQNKERTMREIARVYGEMHRKIDDTNGDLQRLQRG